MFLLSLRKFLKLRQKRNDVKMKSGQIYGQVLIYILTIVLVSVILVYGYNAINNFKERAEQVTLLKFERDLGNLMEALAPDYGSQKTRGFLLPGGMKSICFVDTYDRVIDIPDRTNPIIKDSVKPYIEDRNRLEIKNVFLLDDTVRESFTIPVKMDLDGDDILCIESIGGRVTLKIEGKGDGVEISEV